MKPSNRFLKKASLGMLATSMALVLSACGDNDNDNTPVAESYDFEVSVLNLSHSQPLSPVAVVSHGDEFSGWSIGSAASSALEVLAEGGDNSGFIGLDGVENSASGAGVLLPGATESISLSTEDLSENLTIVSMLVNTNDAFSGVTGFDLSTLEAGASEVVYLPIYDAGTESNSELAGTIPGPADGGEGFNAARDDVDYVARHPGVVSSQDGYDESVLLAAHKFDGPIAKVTITRLN